MKTLALAASNSSVSINASLINWVAKQMRSGCDIIDIHHLEIAMYSFGEEQTSGCPAQLTALYEMFISYDAYIISIPEHNGNFPAFFKNILDWFTRIDRRFFKNKPILLLNASPGSGGGKSVMSIATKSFGIFGARVFGSFIVPEFHSADIDEACANLIPPTFGELKKMIQQFEDEISMDSSLVKEALYETPVRQTL